MDILPDRIALKAHVPGCKRINKNFVGRARPFAMGIEQPLILLQLVSTTENLSHAFCLLTVNKIKNTKKLSIKNQIFY